MSDEIINADVAADAEPPKRPRGRPPKPKEDKPKRPRGRPPKSATMSASVTTDTPMCMPTEATPTEATTIDAPLKNLRGRPRKYEPQKDAPVETYPEYYDEAISDLPDEEKAMVVKKAHRVQKTESGLKTEQQRVTNSDMLRHLANIMRVGATKVDLKKPEEVSARAEQYLLRCAEDRVCPTMEGFAICLGYNRITLINYITGRAKIACQESLQVIMTMYNVLQTYLVTALQNGNTNPVATIFILRNNYGMSNDDNRNALDVIDVDERKLTAEEIAAKYANAPD